MNLFLTVHFRPFTPNTPNTCGCEGYFQNSNNASIEWAIAELDKQMQGMKDITVVGHSKGANVIINYLQDNKYQGRIKNAVLLDVPTDDLFSHLLVKIGLTERSVPQEGANVVNIYHPLDAANNFFYGSVTNAINRFDGTFTRDPHNRKGYLATDVFTIDLSIIGDRNAREQ